MNVMPATMSASCECGRSLRGTALLEEPHRDERHDAGEQRGAESEPEQLHGLHQVAAGGLVVGHAVPLSSVADSRMSEAGSPGASVRTGVGLRGEKPAMARYTATIAA